MESVVPMRPGGNESKEPKTITNLKMTVVCGQKTVRLPFTPEKSTLREVFSMVRKELKDDNANLSLLAPGTIDLMLFPLNSKYAGLARTTVEKPMKSGDIIALIYESSLGSIRDASAYKLYRVQHGVTAMQRNLLGTKFSTYYAHFPLALGQKQSVEFIEMAFSGKKYYLR
jgi:hypothetical protein